MNIYTYHVVDKNGNTQTVYSTLKGSKFIKNKIKTPTLHNLYKREITGRPFSIARVP